MGTQDITPVKHTDAFVKGVINLRGTVVPVICLRTKFKMTEIDYSQRTCIIVVQLCRGNAPVLMGIVADSVSEVLNLSASDIQNAPDFGSTTPMTYVLGMAKVRNWVKILIDIEELLSIRNLVSFDALCS